MNRTQFVVTILQVCLEISAAYMLTSSLSKMTYLYCLGSAECYDLGLVLDFNSLTLVATVHIQVSDRCGKCKQFLEHALAALFDVKKAKLAISAEKWNQVFCFKNDIYKSSSL